MKKITLCECGCGKPVGVYKRTDPRTGAVKGSPCRFLVSHGKGSLTHGCSETPEYLIYCSAKERCNNPKNAAYARYGFRGIRFLFTSFEQFLATVGLRPSITHSLDRRNNDGPYSPKNCRWATKKVQARNRRKRRSFMAQFSNEELKKEIKLRQLPLSFLVEATV